MLLLPTYNATLIVGKYYAVPMTEAQRQVTASTLYSYEVVNGVIVPGSMQVHPGVKWLIQNGLTTAAGVLLMVNPNSLYACLNSGTLFYERYLILREPLVSPEAWVASRLVQAQFSQVGRHEGTAQHPVWCYTPNADPNHVYTEADLLNVYSTVAEAITALGATQAPFQLHRRYLAPYKKVLSSDAPLHGQG